MGFADIYTPPLPLPLLSARPPSPASPPPPFAFGHFIGRTVLWSTECRKCARCGRMIGKVHKGYAYQRPRMPGEDVCKRCHKRMFRRYEKRRPHEAAEATGT